MTENRQKKMATKFMKLKHLKGADLKQELKERDLKLMITKTY